jgi:hypothetical protein
MKYNSTKIFLFFLVLLLTHCNKVKYPENSSKINHPEKLDLMRGFITAYNVNGIDSLDLLNKYSIADSSVGIKIQNIDFDTYDVRQRNIVANTNFGCITYSWNSGYKYLYVVYTPFPLDNVIKRNIFIINGTNWEVLKLIKSKTTVNHQLKIKAEINGNVYQIQFN